MRRRAAWSVRSTGPSSRGLISTVRAIDPAGNTDPSPAKDKFKVLRRCTIAGHHLARL